MTRFPAVIIALLAAVLGIAQTDERASSIRSDELVILFPALAHLGPDNRWHATINGWIYEPEMDSTWRKTALEALDLGESGLHDPAAEEIFNARARAFIVDNERGKRVPLRVGLHTTISEPSRANGHFSATLSFQPDDMESASCTDRPRSIAVRVELPAEDERRFEGRITLVSKTGLSVICDIDDTLRVSNVNDTPALLKSTFFQPFEPIPDVVELCQALAEQNAIFHYVSASPWQLYKPLREFIDSQNLPTHSFHMKTSRLKDETFLSLFEDPIEYKTPLIDSILKRWPGRRFILIGDTSERDPEIYGDIARRYPDRIEHIYIRVSDPFTKNTDARFATAFDGTDMKRWSVIPTRVGPSSP